MGSDNNCNNYYNIDPSSLSTMTSPPYYQTLSSHNTSSQSSAMKNEWSSEPNSSQTQDSEESENQNMQSGSESSSHKSYSHSSSPPSQHHLQMSAPQWGFSSSLGNSYQRFYGDSHYILTSNGSQQSSLHSTPSSSVHSLNSEVPSQSHHQTLHHMQTNQQSLKKIYYQGLKIRFDGKIVKVGKI
jgi:hypothetical protein